MNIGEMTNLKALEMRMPGAPPTVQPSDAAKRASDIINSYITFMPWDELKRKYIAIRLSDGGHDGNLYDSFTEAVRHQSDEKLCYYVWMGNLIGGARPKDMELLLKFARDNYDRGAVFVDPDEVRGQRQTLMTSALRDYYKNLGYR
jgi:hypothetical protein